MHVEKIEVLASRLVDAKAKEQNANNERVAIERQIIDLVGCPDEGAATHDAGEFKIKIDQRVNRKIDEKRWALIAEQIPEAIRPISIVESIKVETAGVRWLKENEPGYYKLLCECMTESPSKPSVKVEVKK